MKVLLQILVKNRICLIILFNKVQIKFIVVNKIPHKIKGFFNNNNNKFSSNSNNNNNN